MKQILRLIRKIALRVFSILMIFFILIIGFYCIKGYQMYQNAIKDKPISQIVSTITQQIAKNLLFTQEKRVERKFEL